MTMHARSILVAAAALALAALLLILGGPSPVRASEPRDLPEPAAGVRVVDPDDRLTADDEASLQAIAAAIERDTSAQIVFVVTVANGWRPTGGDAHLQAMRLMDRWGVGRAGVDDGVVVLVMLDQTRCHGGAYLYLGRGALDAWFGGDESRVQALYDKSVDPRLQRCEVAGALRAAGDGLLQAAVSSTLSDGMLLVLGIVLILAVAVAVATIGWWWFAGRDPRLASDTSIHISQPPVDLTPALAATLMTRGPSDLAFAAALVDDASRGEVTFIHSGQPTPDQPALGLAWPDAPPSPGTPAARPRSPELRALVPRTAPLLTEPEAEWSNALAFALARRGGRMEWWSLVDLVSPRRALLRGLERELVRRGLLARTRDELQLLIVPAGVMAAVAGVVVFFASNPIVQGVLVVAGVIAAGPLAVLALAGAPALTREGVRTRIWLEAFQRTLARTLTHATDLEDALRQARDTGLAWLDTPDRLLAWAVALGLAHHASALLRRTGDAASLPPWTSALDGVSTLASVARLGAVIATFDTKGSGGALSSLGGFGGGISFGGGGGGGSF